MYAIRKVTKSPRPEARKKCKEEPMCTECNAIIECEVELYDSETDYICDECIYIEELSYAGILETQNNLDLYHR